MTWKKTLGLMFILGLARTFNAPAQKLESSTYELALGLQSYSAPLKDMRFASPKPVIMIGISQFINKHQTLELSSRMGYLRNKYHGDALYLQSLVRYLPTFGKHVQAQIGLGLGYQLSFYPDKSWQYNGREWTTGKRVKSVIQIPFQLGLGYRQFNTRFGKFTPYLAWQMQALLRYSPDLNPLPATQWLIGTRLEVNKKSNQP